MFLRQMDNYLKPNQDGSMNNALTKQFDFMEHQNMIKGEDYFTTDRFKSLGILTVTFAVPILMYP